MPTLHQLEDAVRRHALDSGVSLDIVHYLNLGQQEVAGALLLPELATTAEVTTAGSSSTPYVALPTASSGTPAGSVTYMRELQLCFDSDQNRSINIVKSWPRFLDIYPELDGEGSIEHVVVRGLRLYHQPTPGTATALRIEYYRQPIDMSSRNDTPDGIPSHLQHRLLVNYALKELTEYTTTAGPKADAMVNQYSMKYEAALRDLLKYYDGEQSRPEHIIDRG